MTKYVTMQEIRAKRPVNEAKVRKFRDEMLIANSAARLAEIRKSLKMTQRQLAKVIGVDQSNISRLERGNFFTIEFSTLQRYVAALGGEVEVHARFGENSLLLLDSEYEKALTKKGSKKPRHRK